MFDDLTSHPQKLLISYFTNFHVDDVIIDGNDANKIQETKDQLDKQFSINDLGPLKYFLGIEVEKTADGIVLS